MADWTLNPIGSWAFVLGVAAVLVGLLWFGPDRTRTSQRQRLVLTGLRVGVILVVLLTMLRPARIVTETIKQSATLVFLLDQSRSMQVTDSLDGNSRWESLRKILGESAAALDGLAENLELRFYTFDAELHSVPQKPIASGPIELDEIPEGKQTAIGAALEEMTRREMGKRVVGVVLLSDGAQRAYAPFDLPPSTAAGRLADLGYPLYTVSFGQPHGVGQARDIAVVDLLVSPTVYIKNRLEVQGAIRSLGFAGKELLVQLLYETSPGNMEVVASRQMLSSGDGRPQPVRFVYVPEAPGEHKITLQVRRQTGELVTTNNQTSTFVTVLQGGLNALSLASGFPREQRDIRWSLDAAPDIQLQTEYFGTLPRDRQRWPLDLSLELRPGRFDVFILSDLDSDILAPQQWQALADRIDAGAGLMMFGGFHSFGPGGFRRTPLADVLPITMDRLERQNFEEPISQDLHFTGPIRMRPARTQLATHPILMLTAEKENDALWSKLPPLNGANRFRGLKRNARLLAESDQTPAVPLLVAGTWGRGRVLAFAGDSTYRWIQHGMDVAHRRFWRQVVLWLAQKDETRDGDVWIQLAGRRFRPGTRVQFTAGANSPEGEPESNMSLIAQVIRPDGERREVRLSRDGQQKRGTFFETSMAGDYTIEVTASKDGTPLGSVRSRFLVFEQDIELDNPAANPLLLASLAAQTSDLGGRSQAAEELPSLLEELAANPPDLDVEREMKQTYWDTWPVILLFVALLCTEWYLRKRWELV